MVEWSQREGGMRRKATVPLRISSQYASGSRAPGNLHPSPTIAISKPPPNQPAGRRLRPFDAARQATFRQFSTTFSACKRPLARSEEHTSELQSPCNLVCRLLLEKKKIASSGAAWPRRRGLVMAACWSPHASDTTRTVPRTIAPNEINPDLTFNALSLDDYGEACCRGDSAVVMTAGLDRSLERLAVDTDQAEADCIASRPLEVVRVRPVKVAPHIDSITDREPNVGQDLVDVPPAPLIVDARESVLCDVNGFAEPAQLIQHQADPARICAHAHVGHGRTGNIESPDELIPRPAGIEGTHLAPVMGDADVVRGRLDDPAQHPRRDRPAIQSHLRRPSGPAVAPLLRRRQKKQLVMRKPDLRVRPPAFDRAVRQLVRLAQVARDPIQASDVPAAAGRELARHPSVGGANVWLVDGAPEPDEVTELIDHPMHEGQKRNGGSAGCPTPFASKPDRAREVVKGDHRFNALLAQLTQDVAVVTDLTRIELTLRRLDARPLDRQSVGVLLQLAQQSEIVLVSVVVIVCDLGGVAVCDPAGLLLELPPIRVAIVAFDLVGCAGGPPQESRREAPGVRRRHHESRGLLASRPWAGARTPSGPACRPPCPPSASRLCRLPCDTSRARCEGGRRGRSTQPGAGRRG